MYMTDTQIALQEPDDRVRYKLVKEVCDSLKHILHMFQWMGYAPHICRSEHYYIMYVGAHIVTFRENITFITKAQI